MRRAVLVTTCVLLASLAVAAPPRATAATPVTVHRGRTADDAAPSCWAIKAAFPTSASGVYWIQTPLLVTAQPIYCDMAYAGGGWELIARGRDGWSFATAGQGSTLAVALVPSGTGAFAPAALSRTIVRGLLNGAAAGALGDGIRVRRATNATGSQWQEARLHFAFWKPFTWYWPGGQPLRTVTFGAHTWTVGPNVDPNARSTHDVHLDVGWNWLRTAPIPTQRNRAGFAFGPTIHGVTGTSSYLWSATTGWGNALPFTQVWVRPHLDDANVHYTVIPSSGLPAIVQPAFPSSVAQHFDWGVVHVQKPASDPDQMGDSPVYGLAQIGSRMFVGGKFADVEHFVTGNTAPQPWLAAFDVATGAWITTFRPALDGAVFSLAATPDGHLLVAGNFTNVNGVAGTSGLAEIDPISGAPVPGWKAALGAPRFSTPRPYARAVAVRGSWAYVVGSFNRVDGPNGSAVVTGGVARVALADGTPDATWHPFVDAMPMAVDPSADGTRVYVVGSFSHLGVDAQMSEAVDSVAVLDAATGDEITGLGAPQFNAPSHEQLAVTEAGANVAVGGNQHWVAGYRASSFAFVNATVNQPHGDVQVLAMSHGALFVGCHCLGVAITGVPQYTRTDPIGWIGAWDPVTFEPLDTFSPQWHMASTGEGTWAMTTDSSGCLWAGGDMVQGARVSDHLGGFARFCPGDVVAPTRPTGFHATTGTLSWYAATDNSHVAPQYEVLLNDRVVAVQSTRTFRVPRHGRWAVRAVDGAGNRSASTPPVAA